MIDRDRAWKFAHEWLDAWNKHDVFTSPQSILLYYKINRGLLASEVMILNDKMKATKVYANYDKNDVG